MATCCGAEVKTPFCPSCGKQLKPADPLRGLLAHVRSMAKMQETIRENRRNSPSRQPRDDEQKRKRERRQKRDEARCAKWKAWGDALEALLDSQPKEPT